MEATVRISSKNQIVIPSIVRKKLNLKSGDELIIDVEKDRAILCPKPKNYTDYMRGLGKEVWKDVDASVYVQEERQVWEK